MLFKIESISEDDINKAISEVTEYINELKSKKDSNEIKFTIDGLKNKDEEEIFDYIDSFNFNQGEVKKLVELLASLAQINSLIEDADTLLNGPGFDLFLLEKKKKREQVLVDINNIFIKKNQENTRKKLKEVKTFLDKLKLLFMDLYRVREISITRLESAKKGIYSWLISEENKELLVSQLDKKCEEYKKIQEEEKIKAFNQEVDKILLDNSEEIEAANKTLEPEFSEKRQILIENADKINKNILKKFSLNYLTGNMKHIYGDLNIDDYFKVEELEHELSTCYSFDNIAWLMRYYMCKIMNKEVTDDEAKKCFDELGNLALVCANNLEIAEKIRESFEILEYLKDNFYMDNSWYDDGAIYHKELDQMTLKIDLDNPESSKRMLLSLEDTSTFIVKVNNIFTGLKTLKEKCDQEKFNSKKDEEKTVINGFVLLDQDIDGKPYMVTDFSDKSGLVDAGFKTYDYKSELLELINDLTLTGSFKSYEADDFRSTDKVYYDINSRKKPTLMYRLRVRKTSPLRFVERMVVLKKGTKIYDQVVEILLRKIPNVTINGDLNLYVNIANGLKHVDGVIYDTAIKRHDMIGSPVLAALFKDGVYVKNVKTSGIELKAELSEADLKVLEYYIDIALNSYREIDEMGMLSFLYEGNGNKNVKSS